MYVGHKSNAQRNNFFFKRDTASYDKRKEQVLVPRKLGPMKRDIYITCYWPHIHHVFLHKRDLLPGKYISKKIQCLATRETRHIFVDGK